MKPPPTVTYTLRARDLMTAFGVCEFIAVLVMFFVAAFAEHTRINDILFGVILGVIVMCALTRGLFMKIIRDASR